MKKSLFILLLCTATNIANSQSLISPLRKNVFKVNIVPPLLSATSEISYERFVKPNLSIVGGIGANLRAKQSDFQLVADADLEFLNREIQNLYFLAEIRRYIDFCKCAASTRGFYTGGFVRYNSINYTSNLQFGNNNTNLDTKIDLKLRAFNFGALLGYQVNLNNWHFDFEFGGLGYAPNWLSFNSNSTLSNDALARLSNALNRNFGIGRNYKDIELKSSSAELNFWYWTIRYAVSIGYSF